MRWQERDGIKWLEAELPRARAVFSTRGGGRSAAPYASLNLAIKTGDDPEAVRANRAALTAAFGIDPRNVVIGHQVHAAEIAWRDAPQPGSPFAAAERVPEEFDGQATASSELATFVMTADCLPIALAGPQGVVMIHGGWRGLAAGIAAKGAELVGATAAAVGPGIGPCCYEVGEEVLEAFADIPAAAEGRMLDLTRVATELLNRAGVTAVDAMDPRELCTSCNPALFFSHRRDGAQTGRQGGLCWRAP